MNAILKIFLKAAAISFVGGLPLGSLNITAFQIAGFSMLAALIFCVAVVIVEMGVVRISLIFNDRVHVSDKLLKYLAPVGILVLFTMAVYSMFFSSGEISGVSGFAISIGGAFLSGLILSLTNPLQYPYWMAWNKVFFGKSEGEKNNKTFFFYVLGIGFGTSVALACFVFLGAYSIGKWGMLLMYIPIVAGVVYSLTACWFSYRYILSFRINK